MSLLNENRYLSGCWSQVLRLWFWLRKTIIDRLIVLCCGDNADRDNSPSTLQQTSSSASNTTTAVTMNSSSSAAAKRSSASGGGGSAPANTVHKVIMVGSGGVGKSALTLQFMYDEVCMYIRFIFILPQKFGLIGRI